jgi:hypothetical protein
MVDAAEARSRPFDQDFLRALAAIIGFSGSPPIC